MNRTRVSGRLFLSVLVGLAGAGSILSLSGCEIFGVAAQALPPASILPQYKDLKGQSVAILVWADRGVRDDWTDIQLDTAAGLEHKLLAGKPHYDKYMKDTTFPHSALSVFRDQQDHPEWDGVPITDIAANLRVTRLIYVEINSFQTRSNDSTDLYRGNISGSLKVIAIDNGKAKVDYSEDNIQSTYPENSPEEGVLNAGDDKIYTGTLDVFTTALVQRFLPHDEKKD